MHAVPQGQRAKGLREVASTNDLGYRALQGGLRDFETSEPVQDGGVAL